MNSSSYKIRWKRGAVIVISSYHNTLLIMIPAPPSGDKPASYDSCLAMVPAVAFWARVEKSVVCRSRVDTPFCIHQNELHFEVQNDLHINMNYTLMFKIELRIDAITFPFRMITQFSFKTSST